MFLHEFLLAAKHNVVEGGKCDWDFLPKTTRWLDVETDYGWATAYFDSISEEVWRIKVSDSMKRNHNYEWFEPVYKQEFLDSLKNKTADGNIYYQTDTEDDILNKVSSILFNRKFDPDVVLEFDLNEDTKKILENMAKEKNVTFDDLILEAVQNYIFETK
jgi:hypothetical protein